MLLRDGSRDDARCRCPACCSRPRTPTRSTHHAATREVHAALDARRALRALSPRHPPAGRGRARRRVRRSARARTSTRAGASGSPSGSLFVNDQFVTLVRRPARGKAGWPSGWQAAGAAAAARRSRPIRKDLRALQAAATGAGRLAAAPTARALLGDYAGPERRDQQRAARAAVARSTTARCARCAARRRTPTSASMLPYRRVSFGLDAMELRGAGEPRLRRDAEPQGLSRRDPPGPARRAAAPAVRDGVTESYAPSERQTARERIDLALRRLQVGRRGSDGRAAPTCSPRATRSATARSASATTT